MIAGLVFCQNHQMAPGVILVDMLVEIFFGYVNLASENWLERHGALFELGVNLVYIVEELLYAVHVAVVGDGQTGHAVGNSLVDQSVDRRLPVKQ